MAAKKICQTCKHEPEWEERNYPQWMGGAAYSRGKCKFPCGHKVVRSAKLPQGSTISPPWVDFDKPKHNCPAWGPKE